MERAEITDPFFRSLFDRLAPEIDKRMIDLAGGSACTITGDTELERYGAKPEGQT